MQDNLQIFLLCYIPLLVAMDPIGLLPIFLSMTSHMSESDRRRVIFHACFTATVVAFVFMAVGKKVLDILNITNPDFLVAGGIVLFSSAIVDLVGGEKRSRKPKPEDGIGAVPLGVPLIVGPGVMAALLLLLPKYGAFSTSIAMVCCIFTAGVVCLLAPWTLKLLRESGTRAASRIAALLLAAFAVMIIREGLTEIIKGLARAAK
jgi:multiple antibiotic resistance protein